MLDFFSLDPKAYTIAINLFLRLLGVVYIFAYLPFLFQMKGLFGKEGILPITHFLDVVKFRLNSRCYFYFPTLFWLNSSNGAQYLLVLTTLFLATLLTLGVHTPLILFLLYFMHLSLVTAGQDFLSFGWETLLIEITIGAFFLSLTSPYNVIGWISLNFILFRIHFHAGLSKLQSSDPNWRNLTAIYYHYQSQPLPNKLAWYFHKLPMSFHRLSTLFMFWVELIVPLAIFSPPEIRMLVFLQFFALQFFIALTGNFSYLNLMTVILSLILLPNELLIRFFAIPLNLSSSTHLTYNLASLFASAFLMLQFISLLVTFSKSRFLHGLLSWSYPFHLAYPHGIFAVMTTTRYEIILEGSDDGEHWKEYEFRYKPGNLAGRPKQIAPFQPRVDWQAWFLPFNSYYEEKWFQSFLLHLLKGTPSVLKLLKFNPFKEKPPHYIRALTYIYEFTSFAERKVSGNWWKRTYIEEYVEPRRISE